MSHNPCRKRASWAGPLAWLGLVVLLALVLGAASVCAEQTGTLTVINTNDAGPGSLRQAIADASPGSAIKFVLTYPATITLTSGELAIDKALTINGPGSGLLVVSGNGAGRVFRVDKPDGAGQIDVTITGMTITNGRVGDDDDDDGGGLWNDENLSLTDVTFSSNSAGDGGGMYNEGGDPTLTNVTFSNNSASGGGGMYNEDGDPTLTNVTFSSNGASGGGGGGGMINADGNPTLTDVIFNNNGGRYSGGGMINFRGSPTLIDVTFSYNSAYYYLYNGFGGGMVNGGNPTLINVTFSNNSAPYRGGGMYNSSGSNPTLTNVTFSNNSAFMGGGMGNGEGSPTLTDVTFSGNWASLGGGMYNYENTSTLTNVTFSGNSASDDGGGMYNQANSPMLANITFSGNWANLGGGMYNDDSSPTIQNSILWGNRAASGGDQIDNAGGSTPAIAHSDVEGSGGSGAGWDPGLGTDLGGNLDVDPLFVEPVDPAAAPTTAGNLRLRDGSPVIAAGNNNFLPPGVTTDLDGEPRIANCMVDMGAYEFQPLLHLCKTTNHTSAQVGQRITYTLTAINTFTDRVVSGGVISDTLPAGLHFAGPITLDPPGAGTVGLAPPVLVSGLTLNPGQAATLTFPITVEAGVVPGTTLVNRAAITSSQVVTPQFTSHVLWIICCRGYLPIIFRDAGP